MAHRLFTATQCSFGGVRNGWGLGQVIKNLTNQQTTTLHFTVVFKRFFQYDSGNFSDSIEMMLLIENLLVVYFSFFTQDILCMSPTKAEE